jgi:hypothetical protein
MCQILQGLQRGDAHSSNLSLRGWEEAAASGTFLVGFEGLPGFLVSAAISVKKLLRHEGDALLLFGLRSPTDS